MAKAIDSEILKLPQNFCIFNPIKLIWSDDKRRIRKHNDHPESSPAVIDLIRSEVNKITNTKWKDSVQHVQKGKNSFQTNRRKI